MISVESIIYKLDQKLNKLSTNEHQQIPLEDKILYANEAQIVLIKQKFDTEDVRSMGMDSFIKRYKDLQGLVVSWKEINLSSSNKTLHEFSGELKELQPEIMIYIDSYILANKETCKNHVLYTNLIAHGDLTTMLRNNHYKPSFEYQETLVTLSSDKIEVYSDGTFAPKKAAISYLRYPQEIDYEGYEKLDGTQSETRDSELPAYMEDELVNVAVALILGPLTNRTQSPQ